ncbi:sensor histidine kinase [Streptomyces sp. WMMC897]|uniref:sensor histidine kinase n=1 Tax=Streptomyces sp. WMMC897 TaxID=3014782 RepID=UPI0022B68A4C|nr:sensor histidine kinase [Streptomyces sp. WMMC897]MCZ7414002.1 sensor histidine kinase [Streptomyces sp. WMMC897]
MQLPRISMRRHPLAVDIGIALAMLGCALLMGQQDTLEGYPPLDAVGYTLSTAVGLLLCVRRRAPVAVAAGVLALWAAYIALGYWPVVNSLAALLALYTVAAARRLAVAVAVAAVLGMIWTYSAFVSPHGSVPAAAAMGVVVPAVLVRFGRSAHQAERRGERLAELAAHLRAERDEKARRAVADEQARIARELHDVIAHHMSVISVQSGLARYVYRTDPATARRALGTIADTSSEALEEMRRMLTLLRRGSDDPESYAPMPRLSSLAEAAQRVRAGGVPVDLIVEGEARPLPPGVELCAYRVVQEALTNVLKHARPARAEVRVRYRPHSLHVSVTDDGERTDSARTGTGEGHGLIGMRERAKLYGGTVTIGPRPEGGFQVRLALPTSATPAPEERAEG